MKCNRLGCKNEATRHSSIDMGNGMVADAWFCEQHYKEGIASIPQ